MKKIVKKVKKKKRSVIFDLFIYYPSRVEALPMVTVIEQNCCDNLKTYHFFLFLVMVLEII